MNLDLVIAGNLLVDDLVFSDGQTRMNEPGGAVLYAALAASLWSPRIGCASLCGDDYPAAAQLALASRGIDLEGVRALGRPGVRTWLLYEQSGRRMVPRLGCPSHAEVSPRPEALPDSYFRARACHLAPMPLDCQLALAKALQRRQVPLVSLDPHLPITEATLDAWRPLLDCVDVIFPSQEEILLDGLLGDPVKALRRLAGGRLRYVVLKRGADGGLLYDLHRDQQHSWCARPLPIVDPTGAGDSFATGFVTALLDGQTVPAALLRAQVSASFALAGWGPVALLATTAHAAQNRLQEWSVG